MMKFILNPDGKTVHAENPKAECNVPTARAEGEKGTHTVGFTGAAMAWYEDHYTICGHCIGWVDEPDPRS